MTVVTVDYPTPPPPDTFSAVKQVVLSSVINVFPNPASGSLTIHWQAQESCKALLQITDMLGREAIKSEMEITGGTGEKRD